MSWSIASGLEDKEVVVTGAAGDIGRAVAAGFASAGARVCAVDLDQAALDDVVSALLGPAPPSCHRRRPDQYSGPRASSLGGG